MSTTHQIAANRGNALKSTGPRTESGKSTVSTNALCHGLTSKQLIIPGENEADFNALRDSVLEHWCPATERERDIADQLAINEWRLLRARKVEAGFLTRAINSVLEEDPAAEPDDALIAVLTDDPWAKKYKTVQRYVASAERAYTQSLNEMKRMVKARLKVEEELAEAQLLFATRPPIGFVSHSHLSVSTATPLTGDRSSDGAASYTLTS
jgi:hypothetical protein